MENARGKNSGKDFNVSPPGRWISHTDTSDYILLWADVLLMLWQGFLSLTCFPATEPFWDRCKCQQTHFSGDSGERGTGWTQTRVTESASALCVRTLPTTPVPLMCKVNSNLTKLLSRWNFSKTFVKLDGKRSHLVSCSLLKANFINALPYESVSVSDHPRHCKRGQQQKPETIWQCFILPQMEKNPWKWYQQYQYFM